MFKSEQGRPSLSNCT
uniref:Uncharacterized protein n=2 Tax=Anguilla anguilla TaxID=7936 RepID=A0A0E9US88_ANGAN